MVTLAIRGLSLLVKKSGKQYDVMLDPSHGHAPVLAVLTQYLKKPPPTWNPDLVCYVPIQGNIRQLAIWNLGGHRVKFVSATESAGALSGDKLFHFSDFYPGAKTSSPSKKWAVITISQGTPLGIEPRPFDFVKEDGKKVGKGHCALEVQWHDLPATIARGDGKSISFEDGAFVAISNAAPESDVVKALGHVRHYYKVVRNKQGKEIAAKERIGIKSTGTLRTDEVYDCVPPGSVP